MAKKTKQIVIRCSLERPGCIKADGDGGWEVKLTVPDSEKEQLKDISDWRRVDLIGVFMPYAQIKR